MKMNFDLSALQQWFELLCLVHTCRPQRPVDAVVVHARSHGQDGEGLLELVQEMGPTMAPRVVINGGDGTSLNNPGRKAWPGKDAYLKRLAELGIKTKDVIVSEPGLHTRDEAQSFANVIKTHGWTRVAVANHGHCMPRAMCGWVNEIGPSKSNLVGVGLFPICPTSLNWRAQVHGPQGMVVAERLTQCRGELERLLRYQEEYPGNFASIAETVDYLAGLNGG